MKSTKPARYVGVMANETEGFPPFAERQFYARLCELGRGLGLTVYVFSPLRADPERDEVMGYTFTSGSGQRGWKEGTFPLPDLIYDRSFFTRRQDYTLHRAAVRRLHSKKVIPYLGHGLKSKWELAAFLQRDPELRPYLPRTAKLIRPELAIDWLSREAKVFLKPQGGSQGKGTLMAERRSGEYRIRARDSRNQAVERSFKDADAFLDWLRRFVGKRSYLIQQYLDLASKEGDSWDVRSLVQKNGRGLWELTGMAVRRGGPGSITSNIHGGGDALEAGSFLRQQFGAEQAARIEETLRFLSNRIPPVLEASNGRMAELGLDLGVDRDGRVWIIEVNSKPGRSVFQRLSMKEAGYKAARNPMAYASHLLRNSSPIPGSVTAR